MSDTIGDLFDKLSIANIRLWHIEDDRREFANRKENEQDKKTAIELLNKVSSVNKERNSLIDQINRAFRKLFEKNQVFELSSDEILGFGKQKHYSGETENPLNIKREGCDDCTKKHLSQALILLKEYLVGYKPPDHIHLSLAIAHLAEATDEYIEEDIEIAKEIRKIRLKLSDSCNDNIVQCSLIEIENILKKIIGKEENA